MLATTTPKDFRLFEHGPCDALVVGERLLCVGSNFTAGSVLVFDAESDTPTRAVRLDGEQPSAAAVARDEVLVVVHTKLLRLARETLAHRGVVTESSMPLRAVACSPAHPWMCVWIQTRTRRGPRAPAVRRAAPRAAPRRPAPSFDRSHTHLPTLWQEGWAGAPRGGEERGLILVLLSSRPDARLAQRDWR